MCELFYGCNKFELFSQSSVLEKSSSCKWRLPFTAAAAINTVIFVWKSNRSNGAIIIIIHDKLEKQALNRELCAVASLQDSVFFFLLFPFLIRNTTGWGLDRTNKLASSTK